MIGIIFRKDINEDEIVAFFRGSYDMQGFLQCYAHIGQHCRASLEYYYETKPVTEEEYKELLYELKAIYSDIKIYKRGVK